MAEQLFLKDIISVKKSQLVEEEIAMSKKQVRYRMNLDLGKPRRAAYKEYAKAKGLSVSEWLRRMADKEAGYGQSSFLR